MIPQSIALRAYDVVEPATAARERQLSANSGLGSNDSNWPIVAITRWHFLPHNAQR